MVLAVKPNEEVEMSGTMNRGQWRRYAVALIGQQPSGLRMAMPSSGNQVGRGFPM